MVQAVSKQLYGKDAVLSHVMCDLVKNENDTDKSPNIIEDYETANSFLLQSIFSSGINSERIQYQSNCQQQRMAFKRK